MTMMRAREREPHPANDVEPIFFPSTATTSSTRMRLPARHETPSSFGPCSKRKRVGRSFGLSERRRVKVAAERNNNNKRHERALLVQVQATLRRRKDRRRRRRRRATCCFCWLEQCSSHKAEGLFSLLPLGSLKRAERLTLACTARRKLRVRNNIDSRSSSKKNYDNDDNEKSEDSRPPVAAVVR